MQLIKWEKAKQAIIEAKTIDEVKEIRNQAEAMRAYAQQRNESHEVQNNIAEIKIRAERRLGEMLKETKLPGRGGGDVKSSNIMQLDSLQDLGISKIQSHRWQREAELPEEDFESRIHRVKASGDELTSKNIYREATKYLNQQNKTEFPTIPTDKYNVILADPPWEYSNSGLYGSAQDHYLTLQTDDICQLISKFKIDVNSILFLWSTNPLLKDAMKVIESWGFEYKTNFCWIKNKSTYGKLGFYNYGKHELLLVAVKGKFLPSGELSESVIDAPKTIHSKKPENVYEIIEKMYPNCNYLELFSRKKRDKWTSWGNEI